MAKHKIVKYNGGKGALLCNECSVIIATGFSHPDTEHYCTVCKLKIMDAAKELCSIYNCNKVAGIWFGTTPYCFYHFEKR